MPKTALVDYLEVCAKLANSEGQKLIEYLVRMALIEAKPKKMSEQRGV